MRAPVRSLSIALGLCAALGCARAPAGGQSFELRGFKQLAQDGVFLNETLVLHFSADLDASSVTRSSVLVRAADGSAARGTLRVDRNRLEFRPQLPTRADLSDAGFAPDTQYWVEVRGFPLIDGVRSLRGAILSQCWRGSFRTASPSSTTRPLFEDPSLDHGSPLRLLASEIDPLDPIAIECAEPIDPRSVDAAGVELRYYPKARREAGDEPAYERVPLSAVLVANAPESARVELRPLAPSERAGTRVLEPGDYYLWIDPARCRWRDLGGHALRAAWLTETSPTVELSVRPRARAAAAGVQEISFLDANPRSPQAPGDADGTAQWANTGVVTVLLPSAVGNGGDGELALDAAQERADLAAVRVRQPAGASAALRPLPGLAVLRAQSALQLDGLLTRRWPEPERARRAGESWSAWRARAAAEGWSQALTPLDLGPKAPAGRELSAWLARAQADDRPWTVLIAGGDLTINGRVEVDGPLLLAAGGWVRVLGSVEAPEVYLCATGGGGRIREDRGPAGLVIDPPTENPLREPIHVAVLSSPIRPALGLERWLPASVQAEARRGRYQIRYWGESERADREIESIGPVVDPSLLSGCQAVRVRIDLWVDPGGPWDPPRIDEISLRWQLPEEGSTR